MYMYMAKKLSIYNPPAAVTNAHPGNVALPLLSFQPASLEGVIVREKWHLTMFFHIYKVFWSFLHDFNLLNPNPLSARRKRLSNFV